MKLPSATDFEPSLAYAQDLDQANLCPDLADAYHVPSIAAKGYFCGHSLGAMPVAAENEIASLLKQWSEHGVQSYFEPQQGWLKLHETLLPDLAKVVGAQEDEVNIMNSLSVNLHLMATSFYRPTAARYKILIESDAFSTDRFALASQMALHGYDPAQGMLLQKPRSGMYTIETDDLIETIEREHKKLALILLPAVQYLTGQVFEIHKIAQVAKHFDIPIGIDCAHAVGNIELNLHDSQIDFAVWCHYKYMNAGPGSPAGVFVHKRHHQSSLPRLAGWWGVHQSHQFDFKSGFVPRHDARGWQLSCPPLLSMAPLKASLDLYVPHKEKLRQKSEHMTQYLRQLLQTLIPGIKIVTPLANHGAQLSIDLGEDAQALCQALKSQGFFCDTRHELMRIAPVPVYNRYSQIFELVQALSQLLGAHHVATQTHPR